jgi:2-dehydropantoate 2-reductase
MKILIIGAGGVGGYLAYKLKKCGYYLSATDSKGEVKKLKVKDVDKEDEVELDSLSENYDVVFVTVKSYHLDEVIEKYNKFLKNSLVVPILNGIGHFEKFKDFNYKQISPKSLPPSLAAPDRSLQRQMRQEQLVG